VEGEDGARDGAAGREEPARSDSSAARAEAAIRAIAAGADPAAEALSVSNAFTDDLTSRVRSLFGRRKGRGGGSAG
jgi:hypothetical protein